MNNENEVFSLLKIDWSHLRGSRLASVPRSEERRINNQRLERCTMNLQSNTSHVCVVCPLREA